MKPDLAVLAASLPNSPLSDPTALADAGQRLAIEWPADKVALVSAHNGVEGEVGDFGLVLTAVEDLVEANDPPDFMFPDLVLIGGDGGGEALAVHRRTGQVFLVPLIGLPEDWLLLGENLTDAGAPHGPSRRRPTCLHRDRIGPTYEDVAAYRAKRIEQRLTPTMIDSYCRAVGIRPFMRASSVTGSSCRVETSDPTCGTRSPENRPGMSSSRHVTFARIPDAFCGIRPTALAGGGAADKPKSEGQTDDARDT